MTAKDQTLLHATIEKKATTDSGYAIAYAVLRLAEAQQATAVQLGRLGLGDDREPGAVEAAAAHLAKRLEALVEATKNLRYD